MILASQKFLIHALVMNVPARTQNFRLDYGQTWLSENVFLCPQSDTNTLSKTHPVPNAFVQNVYLLWDP